MTVLDQRKAAILRAIVQDYVRDGEPVGSKRLVEDWDLGVSAATVRSEMAALEEAGFITHPHTSAGRVPTDLGYRYFVDSLAGTKTLRPEQRAALEGLLLGATDLEELLRRTTGVLSRVTRFAALVVAPSLDRSRLRHVELVRLGPTSVLAVLIADTGRVDKRMLDLDTAVDDADVQRARHAVNDAVTGLRDVCHGRARRSPRSSASRSAARVAAVAGSGRPRPWASSATAARVPAAPPTCARSSPAAAPSASAASSTPVSQDATRSPNVEVSAGWVSVRASIGVARCCVMSDVKVETCCARSDSTTSTALRAHSISAVSTTSWLVSPRWTHRDASSGSRSRSRATSGTAGLPEASAAMASATMSSSASAHTASSNSVSGAIPMAASTVSQARSTRTMASASCRSVSASPARWSPAHSRFVMWFLRSALVQVGRES